MAKPPRDGGWSTKHDKLAVVHGYESWDDWCSAIEREKGFTICGAKNRQSSPCKNRPAKNGRCKGRHGGKAPHGAASPNFKHGRFSEYMPKGWRDQYEKNRASRDSLDLLHDLAALGVTELQEQLGGLVDGVMDRAREASRDMHDEYESDDEEAFLEAWQRLDKALDDTTVHLHAREGIRDTSEHLRRLADTIRKTETDQFNMVRADRLEMLELFVVDVIRRAAAEYISDARTRMDFLMKVAEDLDEQASGNVIEIGPAAEVA